MTGVMLRLLKFSRIFAQQLMTRLELCSVNKGIDDSWEGIRRMIDVTMMMYGGMERDKAQWKKLFERTGFKLIRILPSAGLFSVVEAEPI
jgi:hypothetical protein